MLDSFNLSRLNCLVRLDNQRMRIFLRLGLAGTLPGK